MDARLDDVKRTVCGKMTIYGKNRWMTAFSGCMVGWRASRCALATDRESSYDPRSRADRRFSNPGRNDLVLQAQLWRLPAPLMANEWRSVVNIGLEYE
jgi:hypothetical protein